MLYFFIWAHDICALWQMIESSDRNDEYDGAMYSQLVCCFTHEPHFIFQLLMLPSLTL
jgi:hypothetical protein